MSRGRRAGRRGRGLGGRHQDLRHRAALRPRAVGAPARRRAAGPAAGRVRDLHQGRPAARAGRPRPLRARHPRASPSRADQRRVFDFSADGVRRSLEASLAVSASTASTSRSSTTPTTTASRRCARRTRRWSSCARRAAVRRDRRRHEPGRDAHPVRHRHRHRRGARRRPLHAARPDRRRRTAARPRRSRGVSVIAGGRVQLGPAGGARRAGATYDYQAAPGPLIERARRLGGRSARGSACRCGPRRRASRWRTPPSPACSSAPAARPRSPTRINAARTRHPGAAVGRR